MDHNEGRVWADDPDAPIHLAGHETDGLTNIVCDELESLSGRDTPFFMAVSYQAPHAPCAPPERFLNLYDELPVAYPPNTVEDAWFHHKAWGADYDVREFRRRYFGEVSQLDAAFGRILDRLEETGLAENTIVELAGLPAQRQTEGRSFAPDLAGAQTPEADVFIEYRHDCMIRGDLKVVTERDTGEVVECFDLKNDPFEMNDIAGALSPQTRAELFRALTAWRTRVRG